MRRAPARRTSTTWSETLLHAWKNRAQFRGESSLLTWVLSIARNRVKMRLRSVKPTVLAAIDREEIPADVLRSAETAAAVRRALEDLDPPHAEVLILRYFDGLPVREIASRLGESEKAVESRLHRAKLALRDRLAQGGNDE